jgi:hypothetical protein
MLCIVTFFCASVIQPHQLSDQVVTLLEPSLTPGSGVIIVLLAWTKVAALSHGIVSTVTVSPSRWFLTSQHFSSSIGTLDTISHAIGTAIDSSSYLADIATVSIFVETSLVPKPDRSHECNVWIRCT